MARLVDDLLDVGRVVTGKIDLDPAADRSGRDRPLVSVASMCCRSETATSVVESRPSPVWVRADPVRLEQIVGNLVSNALKFAPPDRPVRVSVQLPTARRPCCGSTDEGIGIDPDLLPHVFDLFVQGPATIDRTTGGLGIGLTLVHRLVELHGGTVEAFSAGKDQGSTLHGPSAAGHARRRTAARAADPRGAGRAHARAAGRRQRRLARDVLAAPAGRWTRSARGRRRAGGAGDASGVTLPDVAIVDIGLPGIDGYEVARRIRLNRRARRDADRADRLRLSRRPRAFARGRIRSAPGQAGHAGRLATRIEPGPARAWARAPVTGTLLVSPCPP